MLDILCRDMYGTPVFMHPSFMASFLAFTSKLEKYGYYRYSKKDTYAQYGERYTTETGSITYCFHFMANDFMMTEQQFNSLQRKLAKRYNEYIIDITEYAIGMKNPRTLIARPYQSAYLVQFDGKKYLIMSWTWKKILNALLKGQGVPTKKLMRFLKWG